MSRGKNIIGCVAFIDEIGPVFESRSDRGADEAIWKAVKDAAKDEKELNCNIVKYYDDDTALFTNWIAVIQPDGGVFEKEAVVAKIEMTTPVKSLKWLERLN